MTNLWTLANSATDAAIPLKAIEVTGMIDGLILRHTVRQTFCNTTKETVEALYTFPVAWSSVLTEFAAEIAGERLVAHPLPKSEGQREYEEAREAGDAPMMLETSEEGVATATIGNLKPDETVTLSLSFITVLTPQNGIVRFTLPLCIANRYSANGRLGSLQPYEKVESSLTAEYPATAHFTVRGMLADCTVSVPTHPSSTTRRNDELEIRVNRAFADRNLTLLFEDVPDINAAYCAPDPFREGEWSGVMVTTPPRQENQAALQVDLLLDCSGSMGGIGITKLREALASLTDVLTEKDYVTVTRFGSTVDVMQSKPAAFDAFFRRRVFLPLVEQIDADLGGTELLDGLTSALKRPKAKADVHRLVLLITDGEVWDNGNLIERVRRSRLPVFCIGVGSNSVESILREVSEASGGLCDIVTHAEGMTGVTERLLSAARCKPASLSIALPKTNVCWHSPVAAAGRAGCGVKTFLRLKQKPAASLWTEFSDAKALSQAVASAQCVSDEDSDEIAQEYGLLTTNTVLLLVKERAEAEKAVSDKMVHVPQMQNLPEPSFALDFDVPAMSLCSMSPDNFSCVRHRHIDYCREEPDDLDAYDYSPPNENRPLTRYCLFAILLRSSYEELLEENRQEQDFWNELCLREHYPDVIPAQRLEEFRTVTMRQAFPQAQDVEEEVLQAFFILLAVEFLEDMIPLPEAIPALASRQLDRLLGSDEAALNARKHLLEVLKNLIDEAVAADETQDPQEESEE